MEIKGRIILVAGATGHQGGAVAHSLLKEGKFKVRILTRNKEKQEAMAFKEAGAQVNEGDFNDPATLVDALKGVYGVFSVQDFSDGVEKEVTQGKAFADAAKKAGVEHFVYASVGSAERDTSIPHFDSKFRIEEHIRSIGLPATIMRPVFFMYNYNGMRTMIKNGTLYMPLSSDKKLQQLSEDDYGKMVAKVFNEPEYFIGKKIEVASTDITMTEVANTFSSVMDQEVNYRQISFEDFQQQAGDEMTIMFRWFENEGYDANLGDLKNTFFPLTSLESYLQKHDWDKKS